MKRFFTKGLGLVLALCAVFALMAGPALAAEAISMLPVVNDYAGANYADVPADAWYALEARVCYETGLMTGTQNGFEGELTLTGGQLATIAARLRQTVSGEVIVRGTPLPGESLPWYHWEVQYLQNAGITVPDPERPATRAQCATLLAAVVPELYTPAINAVTALPDSDDAAVLRLYNAGILTGTDAYGTFNPYGTLCRHECATMVARVVRPDLRQQFTLDTPPAQTAPLTYEEELMQTGAAWVNGHTVTFGTLLEVMNPIIFETDFSRRANGGEPLDWSAVYSDVGDLPTYFLNQALEQVILDQLAASQASALGCTVADLPQALTPDPAAVLDRVYRAKHILVDDQATAAAILNQIRAAGTLAYFDQLMAQYSTDPGSASNPNGYLFTDGDMVTEFEAAVKALGIDQCYATPVQSQFGWHIILRLDPTGYPDWQRSVQSLMYDHYLDSWMDQATITLNTVELTNLDVEGWYNRYLDSLGW